MFYIIFNPSFLVAINKYMLQRLFVEDKDDTCKRNGWRSDMDGMHAYINIFTVLILGQWDMVYLVLYLSV